MKFQILDPTHPFFKPLWIRIPGIQLLTANLCWTRGTATGCEFTAPLHIAVFDHLVRQAGGDMRR